MIHRNQTLLAIEDVTNKQLAERQQQLAAKVFESSQDAILLLSNNGIINMVNPAFCEFIGYDQNEIIGQHFRELIDFAEYQKIKDSIRVALNTKNLWKGEVKQPRKDGSSIPLFIRINKIIDPHSDETQVAVLASDLRSMKEMERLEHLATHDPLTNLPNRSKLREVLEQQRASSPTFAVLFIDLDSFKNVNDTYGHNMGDKVLQIVARRLTRAVRHNDMTARLAGDEFVTPIRPVSSQADVTDTCQRILTKLRQPMNLGDIVISIGASIGCYYVFGHEYQNIDDILRRADKAMYEAKLSGKRQIVEFNALMPEAVCTEE